MIDRNVVGAHYGLKDWLIQRVTAVVMAAYSFFIAVVILALWPATFDAWYKIFSFGLVKFATFLFALSLFYHAWIGVRDLWMDYIKPVSLRLTLHVLTVLALVGYSGWMAAILWSL
ncbi:MAG: succinate dehydrogenase, hydrophobic membrane anchor protein [Zoogloeaceae bacterium]|nr:succinate dehydrogenase, hydrophobic membrane anchor protein [Zoogloeaceae bacterium]